MANSGNVIHNATVTINGTAITGTTNQTEIRLRRAPVTWTAYGDESMTKDAGVRDEQVRFRGLYTVGATDAFAVLWGIYIGNDGGTAGTVAVADGITSGKTYTGTGKVTELSANLNMGEAGMIDCTIDVNGTFTRA